MGAEAIIPLVIALISLGRQIAEKVPRAKKNFDELAAFLLVLHAEGRDPTPGEVIRFTERALAADDGVQIALRRMRKAAGVPEPEEAVAELPEPEEEVLVFANDDE